MRELGMEGARRRSEGVEESNGEEVNEGTGGIGTNKSFTSACDRSVTGLESFLTDCDRSVKITYTKFFLTDFRSKYLVFGDKYPRLLQRFRGGQKF